VQHLYLRLTNSVAFSSELVKMKNGNIPEYIGHHTLPQLQVLRHED
jgi:hypothetical protein